MHSHDVSSSDESLESWTDDSFEEPKTTLLSL